MTDLELKMEAVHRGYVMLDVANVDLSDDELIDIACASTGIGRERFFERTKENVVSFARFLVSNHWALKGAWGYDVIAKKLGVDKSLVSYSKKLLSYDIKCFKPWQQEAIKRFNGAVKAHRDMWEKSVFKTTDTNA